MVDHLIIKFHDCHVIPLLWAQQISCWVTVQITCACSKMLHSLLLQQPLLSVAGGADVGSAVAFNGQQHHCLVPSPTDSTQFNRIFLGILEQIKPLQLFGQVSGIKFESKFKLLSVIWQSLPKAIPEDKRRFLNATINGSALWVMLRCNSSG